MFAVAHHVADSRRDPFGLFFLRAVDCQLHRRAVGIGGLERFRLASDVELDQMIGDSENISRTAIIALEFDDLAAGIVFFEIEDVPQVLPRQP